MNADTWTRLQAFRHALELTSCEASLTAGYDHLKDFPAGCSELASQTLTDYLTEDGSNLYSCIVGMQWDNGPGRYGHVIADPARDYIDLTLDQFPGYHNRIVAEPVESGGQLAADLNREPAISTADGIVASPSDKVNYITEQNDGKIYTNVPVISTLPAPGIPSLIYHFRRWLLQFVQEHLRSFSY